MRHRTCFLLHGILTSLAVVTHLLDIVPTRYIGLRRETSSIRVLTHSHHVRRDDPLESIGIHLIEPTSNLSRIVSPEECKVPDNHESLDMMRVILHLDTFYYSINTIHGRDSSLIFFASIIPPTFWEFYSLIESILGIDIIIVGEIKLSHILSPSKYLSDESFLWSKWHMPAENSLYNFLGVEKSVIHRRRDIRVMDEHIILIHRIFESPEIFWMIL